MDFVSDFFTKRGDKGFESTPIYWWKDNKMSKMFVLELDVCHKFVEEIKFDISFDQRSKWTTTQHVGCSEFNIFIGFTSGHFDIDILISKITEEKKSDLCQHWGKLHRPLVQRGKYMKLSPNDFGHEVVITFVVV